MKTIGLFDSGVGGLTCLRTIVETFPGHKFIYLGDTARLPYGTKSQETIKKYTLQNISTLETLGVDVIISACHSASSAILLQDIKIDRPLLEVITPSCQDAAQLKGDVGVIATAATTDSGIYPKILQQIHGEYLVFQQACPLLVSLVETGWIDDPITNLIIQRYLKPLLDKNVESIILGCTHFPALAKPIKNIVGPEIQLIDPAQSLTQNLKELMGETRGLRTTIEAYLTDVSPHFVELAQKLLGPELSKQIQLNQI